MHVAYIDRGSAQSIWRMMDAVAVETVRRGGRATYLRFLDPDAPPPPVVPQEVECVDIVVPSKRHPWQLFSQVKHFRNRFGDWLKSGIPDIVHTNFCVPGSWVRRDAKVRHHVPVVTTCHEMPTKLNRALRLHSHWTERYADALVFVSKEVAFAYAKPIKDGLQSSEEAFERYQVIPNGLDVPKLNAIVTTARAEKDLREATGSVSLVSVGRLVPEKGHGHVLNAITKLLCQYPSLTYTVFGDGWYRDELERSARALGIAKHLRLPGWASYEDVITAMASADAVVVPSIHEGFGLALAEAMMCRVPIIASDIPVFREVVAEASRAVFFFDIENEDDLVQNISSAIDKKMTQSQADLLVRRVEQNYSIDGMVTSYLALYEKIWCGNEMHKV